ncbi:hypothetical protein HDU92_006901, partial [Lobulomyces angularis]
MYINEESHSIHSRQLDFTNLTEKNILSNLQPTQEQLKTIYILCAYVVIIGIFWNVKYLKEILYPFKLITVALHEFGHASCGLCTGAKIVSITVEPNQGGVTTMRGGIQACSLPAGYLGSSFWGILMIFAGFNILAS